MKMVHSQESNWWSGGSCIRERTCDEGDRTAELGMQKGNFLRCWESLMAEMKRRDRHFLDAGSSLN
jgi:hypothetical protein